MTTRTVSLAIKYAPGPCAVDAQPATPGLYVHRAPEPGIDPLCSWRLTHHSGYAIAGFSSAENAHLAAEVIADLADWTAAADVIRSVISSAEQRSELWHHITDAGGHFPDSNCFG